MQWSSWLTLSVHSQKDGSFVNSLYKLTYISTQKAGIQLSRSFFLKCPGTDIKSKPPVFFLGAGNASSQVSKKSCGYAGLLGEALSVSGPGHVLSLMHGSDVSVNRAASQV